MRPTVSQMQALEDTIAHGDPWARVFGQAQHGGWSGVMTVLSRNRWVRYNERTRKHVITKAGQKVYDDEMLRQRTAWRKKA